MFDQKDGSLLEEYGKTLPAMSALRDSMLSTRDKHVLWAMMSRCQPIRETGWVCWPSVARIALDTGYGSSTVHASLNELERLGLITRDSGNSTSSNTYIVDYAAILTLPPHPKQKKLPRSIPRG